MFMLFNCLSESIYKSDSESEESIKLFIGFGILYLSFIFKNTWSFCSITFSYETLCVIFLVV